MDHWFKHIHTFLMHLVLPVFLTVWIGGLVLLIWRERSPKRAEIVNRLMKAIAWLAIPFFALLTVSVFGLECAARFRFASQSSDQLVLLNELQISGSHVAELIKIVNDADFVRAHHSHSVEPILIHFIGDDYRYSLSRDSHNSDEYWLFWIDSDQSGKNNELCLLKHFRSKELTNYLVERTLVQRRR